MDMKIINIFNNIVDNLQNRLNRKLLKREINTVIKFLRNIDLSNYDGTSHKMVINILYNFIKTRNIRQITSVDGKQMLNETKSTEQFTTKSKDLHIDSIFGLTNYKLKLLLNPKSLHKKYYICLDSFNKNLTTSDDVNFSWDVSRNNSITKGSIVLSDNVKDLIQIKIYEPIIPIPIEGINLDARRISILFKEFSNQAFISNENRKYHFLTKPYYDQGLIVKQTSVILDTTGYHNGTCIFKNPITNIDRFTINFGQPDELCRFYDDRLYATLTAGATTLLTFATNHNFLIGSDTVVSIADFTTATVAVDYSTITTINRTKGHIATVTTSTQMTIPIDTSTITIPSTSFEVMFFDRRVYLCAELTCL